MRPITNFIAAGTLALGAIGISTAALATAYTISGEAAQDIGTGSFQQRDTTGSPPNVSSAFSNQPFAATPDPDKGCDDDAFFNFSGLGQGVANVKTCGDTMIAQWIGGNTGFVSGGANLTATTFGNQAGLAFHVEDSAGSGTQTGSLTETLGITGVNTNTFSLPFTVNFGNAGDSFQISAFDISVCIKTSGNGACNSNNGVIYHVVSGGTSVLGFNNQNDDEHALETNLFGCILSEAVSGEYTAAHVTSCQSTVSTVANFVANDPPPVDAVPEPASLAILGSALVSLRLARRRRA